MNIDIILFFYFDFIVYHIVKLDIITNFLRINNNSHFEA